MGLVVLGICTLGACATGGGPGTPSNGCPLRERDSTFVAGGPVFRDCAVDVKARFVSGNQRPDFRPTAVRNDCYFADLEFVVSPSGTPETQSARIERTNDQGYADAVMATLGTWKYEPSMRAGVAVRQIVSEHRAMSTVVLRVPAGGSPPSGPPGGQRQPSC